MLSDKFFNSFVSEIFWRRPHLSKLRAGLSEASKSFTLGLSQRFFLNAGEGVDVVASEEMGQFRLHLRNIFAYNRAAFHSAKWDTAAMGGFVQLADLFFSKQQCYWAGGGNYGYRAGGASPLFFQNLSNFSPVTSFERILFSSETRLALGRFLLRFNQIAPFYLNGLGRKNTSLINYRAKPQSQFLRELEPITKIPAELFDTFLYPMRSFANLQNRSSGIMLRPLGLTSGMSSQRLVASRLVYLNDFASFLRLSGQYRQRHLAHTYAGFAFDNGTHAVNSWTISLGGCGVGGLYAVCGFFNIARRAALQITPHRKTNFLISCGFLHFGQNDFSVFSIALRFARRDHARRLSRVIPFSRDRAQARALLQMERQLLTRRLRSRSSSERTSLPATYERNRFNVFFPVYLNALIVASKLNASLRYRADGKAQPSLTARAGLARLLEWETVLAAKYTAALDAAASLEIKSTSEYNAALYLRADIEHDVIQNHTLSLDEFALDAKLLKSQHATKLKLFREVQTKALRHLLAAEKHAAPVEISALIEYNAEVEHNALLKFNANLGNLVALQHGLHTTAAAEAADGGDVTLTLEIDLKRDVGLEFIAHLAKNAHLKYTTAKRNALYLYSSTALETRKASASLKKSTRSLDAWYKLELLRIMGKRSHDKVGIRAAYQRSERLRYQETIRYMRRLTVKAARLRGGPAGPYVALKHPAVLNYYLAWLCSQTAEYKAAFPPRCRLRLTKRGSRISPLARSKPLPVARALKPWGAEKGRSLGPVTGAALGFSQTLLTVITGAAFSKLTPLSTTLNVTTVRRNYYRLWFNKLVVRGGSTFSGYSSNFLFTLFDLTGALSGRTLGIVGQLFRKSFYARRYLKLFSVYNELMLTQMHGFAAKHWLYRLAKVNERASIRRLHRAAARFAPLKYAELLTTSSNALTRMRTHTEMALAETSEIGLMGFARAGASKSHAEFFLLFSSAQFGWGSTLMNHRTLSPINRFTASRSRRQPIRFNFDMEFFDRIAGVMWSTNVAFPAKGRASIANPCVMSQFNVTLGISSFAPEYKQSWFFNSLDSVQSLSLTRNIFGGDAAISTSAFSHELVVCLPWSVDFYGLGASAALLRSSIKLGSRRGGRAFSLTVAVFWGRIYSLSFYDL